MDAPTRALLWARAGGRCEYCRVHQDHVELSHHIEHIVARKHGGADDLSNLCVACERCNLYANRQLIA
jgi:5-methylcytosine-specific restriction endonuclease McrA